MKTNRLINSLDGGEHPKPLISHPFRTYRKFKFGVPLIILTLLLSCTTFFGCWFLMGDSSVMINGNVLCGDANYKEFKLELYLAENDRLLRSKSININFQEGFVISPTRHAYYFLIRTDDSTYCYKSQVFVLPASNYAEPISLGNAHLKPYNVYRDHVHLPSKT